MSIAKQYRCGQQVELTREPWLCEATQAWLKTAVEERHVRPRDMLAVLLVDLVGCSLPFAANLLKCDKGHLSRRVHLTRSQLAELPPPAL